MSAAKKILVTGANGQLGKSLKKTAISDKNHYFFYDRKKLDITDYKNLKQVLQQLKPDYCLNFAAYTRVDEAENQQKKAYEINAIAPGNLAGLTADMGISLIHISTDYVFDGKKKTPYREEDEPNPVNVYGKSKLEGEKKIIQNSDDYFIIRTAWLYSENSQNFFNTIIKLAREKSVLKVVADQKGTPTLTYDLLDFIIYLINNKDKQSGIYHYSGKGEASWFDFARAIMDNLGIKKEIVPVTTREFVMKAPRPSYSVLDKQKIISKWNYIPPDWKESLKNWIKNKGYAHNKSFK